VASRAESGEVVMAMYRPKAGRDAEVRALIAKHVPALRRLGLATSRPVLLLRASDGTYVEIFEWVPGGAQRAHESPDVGAIWKAYEPVCDYVSLKDLPDANRPFPHFRPVDGVTV
jgi:hypothetical protein